MATRLADLLSADRLVVPLAGTTLAAAATALLERAAAAGAVSDPELVARRLAEEHAEEIVAMGDRAFLLHQRSDRVSHLVVALGTSPLPICRELGDGDRQCARVVLLVLAPPRLAARYLQVVGTFARFLASPDRVEQLLAAPTAAALAALPVLAEYVVPDQLLVRDIMTARPRCVAPDAPLRDAAASMVRAGVGALPVVDAQGMVVGMLSERELMRHFLTSYLQGGAPARPSSGAGQGRRLVRDVMTRQVLCVSPDQPLADVASLLVNKDVDRVPVVKEGRLVGFLTRGDIVRKFIGSA